EGVLGAVLKIHLTDELVLIIVDGLNKAVSAARIAGLRERFDDIQCRRIEQSGGDFVAYERGGERHRAPAVTERARDRCPVAAEHLRGGYMAQVGGWLLPGQSFLPPPEEE